MKKQVGIVLIELIPVEPGGSQNDPAKYKVSQIRNSVEWSIGQLLTRAEVLAIFKRTGPKEVEVIIKEV